MTKYREILRLSSLGFSNRDIALSVPCSRNTVSKVLKRAQELKLCWPLQDNQTDEALEKLFYPKLNNRPQKRMPDYAYIRKELLRNGVSKKLLWTEYMEDCRANGEEPLMYSQFCYHIQQEEQKHRATMHINRKPGEQVEVDWAGDPATIIDPDTGEIIKAYIFVGVMTYSQYAYVEAFLDMKQKSWINAHVHMYEYFGGVARILVPDNCKTAVIHNGGFKDQQINETYQEMAEHYGTAIIPARVSVFCKPFLHKIAKSFCRLLHLHFVGNCKTTAGSYSASHKPLQIIFSCYNTRYGNGSSEFSSSCACSLK